MAIKQKLYDIFHPFKAFERKSKAFLATYKKEYSERTDAEKIVCEAWYKLNFISPTNLRYLGAIEAILVMEKYLDPGTDFIPKNSTYEKTIMKHAEQYLKDKEIL